MDDVAPNGVVVIVGPKYTSQGSSFGAAIKAFPGDYEGAHVYAVEWESPEALQRHLEHYPNTVRRGHTLCLPRVEVSQTGDWTYPMGARKRLLGRIQDETL